MAELDYTYHGPPSGVTLKVEEEDREVLLHPGAVVRLPEEHAYTRRLVAQGRLTEVPVKERRASPVTAEDEVPATAGDEVSPAKPARNRKEAI